MRNPVVVRCGLAAMILCNTLPQVAGAQASVAGVEYPVGIPREFRLS